MSDHRRPASSWMLRKQGKRAVKVECFNAQDFDDAADGALPGLFRLRIDGVWYRAQGEQYTFLSPEGVWRVLERHAFEEQAELHRPPPLVKGDHVRAWLGERDGVPVNERCVLASNPMQDEHGRWHVLVFTYRLGRVLLPVQQVSRLEDTAKSKCKHCA
ncbi:hypothetical protein DGI_2360 [Megalodesulfovibrio gigas DSM 1382 = ATCC 19364]|uniref:Uncharacterized protein n=1 Tax=Megalodesulfovibrio gigas (strain ATCC 19364 / DSM 1382 / NCIMB 9332 / VKM B-1759) TaxID=1121448 RepID=T2GE01_MEGG1|nr:hypothetical protein DGI_2360 [Megalodesulfovibrio gigas DSM 1382 = ATCC 19364]